jgi:hypothetical protein
MMVKAEGSVQGYVERKGKENRVYRSLDLYVKGKAVTADKVWTCRSSQKFRIHYLSHGSW